MDRPIKVTCQGAATANWMDLVPFQGDLKTLTEENFNRLKKQIIKHGFNSPIHVWRNEGKLFCLDGHQRLRVISKLAAEGDLIPPLPIDYVEAGSINEAKRILLGKVSQFGELSYQGLYEYIHEAEIPWVDVKEDYDIPNLNLNQFEDEFAEKMDSDETGGAVERFRIEVEFGNEKEMKNVSDELSARGLIVRAL